MLYEAGSNERSCQAVCMADCKAGLHTVNHLVQQFMIHFVQCLHATYFVSTWFMSLLLLCMRSDYAASDLQ